MKFSKLSVLKVSFVVSIFISVSAVAENSDWGKLIDSYEKEFKNNEYQNLSKYHGIITICDSLPSDESQLEIWLMENAPNDSEFAAKFENNIKSCNKIEKKGYRVLERLFRKAKKSNAREADLLLANLIPFNSKEKIDLLYRSSTWSTDAVIILAGISMDEVEHLTNEERYFWRSVSPLNILEGDVPNSSLLELKFLLSDNIISQIDTSISKWNVSDESSKGDVIENLKLLAAND